MPLDDTERTAADLEHLTAADLVMVKEFLLGDWLQNQLAERNFRSYGRAVEGMGLDLAAAFSSINSKAPRSALQSVSDSPAAGDPAVKQHFAAGASRAEIEELFGANWRSVWSASELKRKEILLSPQVEGDRCARCAALLIDNTTLLDSERQLRVSLVAESAGPEGSGSHDRSGRLVRCRLDGCPGVSAEKA